MELANPGSLENGCKRKAFNRLTDWTFLSRHRRYNASVRSATEISLSPYCKVVTFFHPKTVWWGDIHPYLPRLYACQPRF